MDDHIRRADAIKAFHDALDGGFVIQNDAQSERIINEIPAADVQAVVYCKDCIHLGFKDFNGICNGPMCGVVKPWDFCSHGVRGGADG